MRRISKNVLPFWTDDDQNNKTLRDYRRAYKSLDEILNQHPEILDIVHRDLEKLSRATGRKGRNAVLTSENLFRAIIVMQREGLDYREASVRIAESETLQNFCKLIRKKTIDFTLLNKAFCAIPPESWAKINHLLALGAVKDGLVSSDQVRTDTTVTETNIHWPTDSSLMWDSYRVIVRLINQAREVERGIFPERFHPKKIKRLDWFIARYAKSTNKKRRTLVRRKVRTMIDRLTQALRKAEKFIEKSRYSCIEVQAIAAELNRYLPSMRQVVDVARRRAIDGEKVPHDEKVFSIFEPHTELIMRGRRGKPVEFGHKILLSQSPEKFITDYAVLEENKSDANLLPVVIERHEERFGYRPKVVAADKGFCPEADEYEDLEELVDCLAVPRRTRDFGDAMMSLFQKWRAGIEGTISCLKRVFRLARCCFRGFKNFASAIGSAVFCHNLTVLAKLESG